MIEYGPGVTSVEQADSETFDAVVLLYLAASKIPDGDLNAAEATRILELTRKHAKGLTGGYPQQVIKDVATKFAEAPDTDAKLSQIVAGAQRLAEHLDPHAKLDLVDDLQSIAEADGVVSSPERTFVEAAAKTLGLSLS